MCRNYRGNIANEINMLGVLSSRLVWYVVLLIAIAFFLGLHFSVYTGSLILPR